MFPRARVPRYRYLLLNNQTPVFVGSRKSRRDFLISATGSAMLLGCNRSPSEPAPQSSMQPVRSDVPLRVLLCGDKRWSEMLTTAWSGVSDQALQVTPLDPAVVSVDQWQDKVMAAMKLADVGIVPTGMLAALDAESAFTPPSDDWLSEEGVNFASLFPVIREGLITFGGRTVALPQGAIQPSVVVRTDLASGALALPGDWESYIRLATELNGSSGDDKEPVVAEPLAPGDAARMFLWRANTANPPVWLFERETFTSVIDQEPYVETLETLKRCASQYRGARLTAGEVWSRITAGQLKMAIAWPAISSQSERIEEATSCDFGRLPSLSKATERTGSDSTEPAAAKSIATVRQTLIDTESPVAVMSSHCRQSESAKRFLTWLIDGEGTSMIRTAVTGLTPLRAESSVASREEEQSDVDAAISNAQDYMSVLSESLSSLNLRPAPRLLHYRKYLATLDTAVQSCLDGKQSSQEALSVAAKTWDALTQEVGEMPQHRAWRRTQGLRN